MTVLSACSSSSNTGPEYASRYHLFSADIGTLEPKLDGSYSLRLYGPSIEAAWLKESAGTLICDKENPSELINSQWELQYKTESPNAIIFIEDGEGSVSGYFLSLTEPACTADEVSFNAEWIGSTTTGYAAPADTISFSDMLMLVMKEDSPSDCGAEEVVYNAGQTGLDPELALAMANINFAESIGLVLSNKTNDMQSDVNMINGYEGDKNTVRVVMQKIVASETPGPDDIAGLAALGLTELPTCSNLSSNDCKNTWLDLLQDKLDAISGQQQAYITRSQTDQLALQQLMNTYNQSIQLATNMIAAYQRTLDSIAANIR